MAVRELVPPQRIVSDSRPSRQSVGHGEERDTMAQVTLIADTLGFAQKTGTCCSQKSQKGVSGLAANASQRAVAGQR